MSRWTPQPAGLQEILTTIHDSTTTNAAIQRSITEVSVDHRETAMFSPAP